MTDEPMQKISEEKTWDTGYRDAGLLLSLRTGEGHCLSQLALISLRDAISRTASERHKGELISYVDGFRSRMHTHDQDCARALARAATTPGRAHLESVAPMPKPPPLPEPPSALADSLRLSETDKTPAAVKKFPPLVYTPILLFCEFELDGIDGTGFVRVCKDVLWPGVPLAGMTVFQSGMPAAVGDLRTKITGVEFDLDELEEPPRLAVETDRIDLGLVLLRPSAFDTPRALFESVLQHLRDSGWEVTDGEWCPKDADAAVRYGDDA